MCCTILLTEIISSYFKHKQIAYYYYLSYSLPYNSVPTHAYYHNFLPRTTLHDLLVQMLLSELYGLDTCFLHSLVTCGGGEGEGGFTGDPPPLVLQPYLENPWLQFQTVRDPSTNCEVQLLQAGHPQGLLAYLFTL